MFDNLMLAKQETMPEPLQWPSDKPTPGTLQQPEQKKGVSWKDLQATAGDPAEGNGAAPYGTGKGAKAELGDGGRQNEQTAGYPQKAPERISAKAGDPVKAQETLSATAGDQKAPGAISATVGKQRVPEA